LLLMSDVYVIADVDYCRRCRLLPLFLLLPLLSPLPLMSMRLMPCLHSELDTAGQADALEIPPLLSSDVIPADIELDQRPHIGDGISNDNGTRDRTLWFAALHLAAVCVLVELVA
jgi:hypothetical protein